MRAKAPSHLTNVKVAKAPTVTTANVSGRREDEGAEGDDHESCYEAGEGREQVGQEDGNHHHDVDDG